MRRDRTEIIYDILKAVQDKGGRIKPTHLLYKSNLSHSRMKNYVNELMENEMLVEDELKGNKMYSITDKGNDFIAKFRGMKEFMDSFGI